MPNDINITINSAAGEAATGSAGAGDAPSPQGLDALGSPADALRGAAAGSAGDAPVPMPLDQLGAPAAGADAGDAAGQPPSPSNSFGAADGTSAPEPLPPGELLDK